MSRAVVRARRETSDAHASHGALWAPIGLVALTFAFFWPLLGAQFTLRDDAITVSRNPAMLGPISEVRRFWTNLQKPDGDIYIPLTQTV